MKKYFTIIAGLLFLLVFAQCKKDEPVTPNDDNNNNGKVEIPVGMSHTDIVVTNFVEDAIPDEDGGFEVGNGRMLIAKNANNDKLIYIALYSTDISTGKGTVEEVDRQLSAKETALYFALSVFPNGFGELPDNKFNALKNILYSLECVQQLETAIQQTVDQYGYLKEDAINGHIETVRRFFYESLISPLMEAAGRGQKTLNPPVADPDHFGQIAKIDINSSTYNADDDSWDIQTTCWNALGICVGVVEGTEISETEGMFDPWSMAAFLDPTLVSNVFSFEEVLSWQHYVDLFNDFSNVLHGNADAFMTTGVSRWDVNFNLNRDEDAIFFVGPEFRSVQVANFVHLAWETVKFVAEMCVGNNMPEWYNFEVMVAEIAQDVNYLNRIQEWTETFDDGLFTALYFETMRKMGAFWASHGFFGVQQLEVYNSYTAMVSAFAFGCDLFAGYVEYSLCNTFYFYVGGDHATPADEVLPGLITNSYEVVSSTQATVTGALIEEGTHSVVERGICYGTMPNPTPYGNHVVADGTGIGAFTCTLTDLQPNTKYYARSYAKNELGNVGYGNEVSFTTYSAVPIITTYPVESATITSTSAVFRGKVEEVPSSEIQTRGFCYNTTPYFTVNTPGVSIVNAGNGTGEFTAVATGLTPGTTYYYLAYVESNGEFFHGPEMNFTTLPSGGGGGPQEYVDLGLPSGTLWATCNVGANAPEEYGGYFAWGETQPKDYYEWSNYQYCNGSGSTLTKYCNYFNWGYNGFTDNLTILEPCDDAATALLGSDWRMPTKEEWDELESNTTNYWTTRNGVAGWLFLAPNGNSLFIPAAGMFAPEYMYSGSRGNYWSSSLYTTLTPSAWEFCFDEGGNNGVMWSIMSRRHGQPIRPVRATSHVVSYAVNATPNPVEGGSVVVTGGSQSGTTCTLTATANEGYTFTNWTENGTVVSTNATYSFTLTGNRTLVANFTANGGGGGSYNGHDYVDLGLPSGTLWATCNVGANAPEENGDYFAWGETQMKENYVWSTYQHCMGSLNTYTKYCNSSMYGNVDDLTILEPIDDAATSNWGNGWRMPTQAEWEELLQNTTSTATYLNGVRGRYFTATNGNRIFLPCAGQYQEDYYYYDVDGYYWSSSLYLNYAGKAWGLCFDQWNIGMAYKSRSWGWSVRPVRSAR